MPTVSSPSSLSTRSRTPIARRVLLALTSLAIPAFAGGCGAGGGGGSEPPPAPFEVVATTPISNQLGVPAEGLWVRLELSAPALAASVNTGNVTALVNGFPVPTVLALSPDAEVLEVTLGGALPPGSTIEVTLTSVVRASDGAILATGPANPLHFTLAPAEVVMPDGSVTDPGRYAPAFAPLSDGRLFVCGGLGKTGIVRTDAEIGSGVDDHWVTTAGPMGVTRWAHGAGLLSEGRVLVLGGFTDGDGLVPTATTEAFDPTEGTFTPGPVLAVARAEASLVRTTDGLLVVIGGSAGYGGNATTSTIEAFDPAIGTFSTLSTGLPVAATDVSASPLPDGAFLVAGGVDASGGVLATACVFAPGDTTTRTILPTGLETARRGAPAILAATDEVFVFGGVGASGELLSSIERFDPLTSKFTTLSSSLSEPRSHATVVALPNGAIAVVGGRSSGGVASSVVDVFDPTSMALLATVRMAQAFAGGAAFALPTGGLVLVGGATSSLIPPPTRGARSVLTPSALGASIAAPRVVSFDPYPGIELVDVDAPVKVRFSKPVEESSLVGAVKVTDAEGKTVEGAVSLLTDRVTAVFQPSNPWPVLQKLRVEVLTTVTDRVGTPLFDDGTRFTSFTTGYDVVVGAADDGSQFGYAVAKGDVNGDGIDDIVVSAYVAEPVPGSGVKPGQAYVIFGKTTWGPAGPPVYRNLTLAPQVADLTISFETNGDQPGIESALQVTDLDADGYDDVIVGVHSADGPTEAASNAGEVFVVFGQASFPTKSLQLGKSAVAGFDVLRIYGAAASDRLGEGLATGDVDADGYPDVIVGATGVSVSGATSVGAVYVVFGGTKASLGVVSGYGSDTIGANAAVLTNVAILGTDASDRLGWSAACGDLDGDGYADIVGGSTGSKGLGNAASSTGEAVIVFGAPRATLVPTGRFASYRSGLGITLPSITIYGDDGSDFFAWAMKTGDLDGDGKADLAVGALLADGLGNVGNGRGEADIVFGAPRGALLPLGSTWAGYDLGAGVGGARITRLHGEADGHSFGDCFEIGDVDVDGRPDLLIGDYQARGPLDAIGANVGEISVLRGAGLVSLGGTTEFALSTDGTTHPADVRLTRFYGKAKVVRFGTTLAVGDFNADGWPDVLTGANQAKGLGRLFNNGGEAYVFWGRPTWWK